MLPKLPRALEISPRQSEDSTPDPEYPRGSDRSLPRNNSNQKGMPLPDIFHDTMTSEWENPVKPSLLTQAVFSGANKEIKLPLVDDPVNCLASASVLPMDADGLPKDQCDRRIEWHFVEILRPMQMQLGLQHQVPCLQGRHMSGPLTWHRQT